MILGLGVSFHQTGISILKASEWRPQKLDVVQLMGFWKKEHGANANDLTKWFSNSAGQAESGELYS